MTRRALALLLLFASPLVAAEPPKLDRHGMPLPPGAIARLGDARLRHASPVTSLAFSTDGTRLLSVCSDNSVHVWNVKTGLPVAQLPAGSAQSAALPPDGKSLVLIDPKGHFKQYDLSDVRKPLRDERIEGYTGGLAVLAPDGGSFAYLHGARDEEHYHVIRIADWKVTAEIASPQPGQVLAVQFSGDGSRVGFIDGTGTSPKGVRVHESRGGRLVFSQIREGQWVSRLRLSAKGNRVAVVYRRDVGPKSGVLVWDVASGRLLADRQIRDTTVWGATLSEDGGVAVLNSDSDLWLLDVASGWAVRTLAMRGIPDTMVFDPSGRRLAVVRDKYAVEVIDISERRTMRPADGDLPDSDLFPASNGRLAARGTEYFEPRVWTLTTGESVAVPVPRTARPGWSLASWDLRWLTYMRGDWEPRVRDRQADQDTLSITHGTNRVRALRYTPDGQQLVVVRTKPLAVTVYELATGKPLVERTLPVFAEDDVWLSHDCAHLSVAELGPRATPADSWKATGVIRRWNVITGREESPVRWAPVEQVRNIPFSMMAFSTSEDGRVVAVKQRDLVPSPPNGVLAAEVSIRILGPIAGRDAKVPRGTGAEEDNPLVSPDGRLLVLTGRGAEVEVFDTLTLTRRARLTGHGQRVTHAIFTPDSRYLITVSPDQMGLVWDVRQPFNSFAPSSHSQAWDSLDLREAEKPHAAIAWLVARPAEAVPFLAKRVKAPDAPDAQQVAEWIKQLDSDTFREREAAEAKLRGAAWDFAKSLEGAANTTTSPEVRQRLRKLLAAKDRWELPPDEMRALRAIEVLERIGTPAARDVLKKLATGPADAWVTRDAAASLERLTKR